MKTEYTLTEIEDVWMELRKMRCLLEFLYQCEEVSLLGKDTMPSFSLVLKDILEKIEELLELGEGCV